MDQILVWTHYVDGPISNLVLESIFGVGNAALGLDSKFWAQLRPRQLIVGLFDIIFFFFLYF